MKMMRRGFTLIELLVVIAIIAILAAFLFPVFARAKAEAKKTACISNLKRIGSAIALYMGDHGDLFPHALDASDKFAPEIWENSPDFSNRIPYMPLLHEVVQPYCKNKDVFKCPADSGTQVLDNHFLTPLRADPTMYAVYGSSYFFRTEIAFRYFSQSQFRLPANVNVLFDGAGQWHGSTGALTQTDSLQTYFEKLRGFRYNTLYGDFHARSLNYDQLQEAWSVQL
jgi:general secretion pathway protein G